MPRGTVRTAVLILVCVLAAGCTGGRTDPAVSGEGSGRPVERQYWPTDAWRTAPPEEHGLDADELDLLEETVADAVIPASTVRLIAQVLVPAVAD